MALPVAYKIGTSSAYGNVVARSSFTPAQQAIMDSGGNYAGYAVVQGHFTYVGTGATGVEAYNRVFQTATSAPGLPGKEWMSGPAGVVGAVAGSPGAPSVGPTMATAPGDPTNPVDAATQTAKDATNKDALARIKDVLGQYGLGSLSGFVWEAIVSGMSEAQILQAIRETPQFKERFPAISERVAKGLPPLSPAEYIAYEQTATQIMRAAGIPQGFWDSPDDFKNLLAKDVSVKELSDRVDLWQQELYQKPPEVRAALRSKFGMGDGDMLAYIIDPDRALPLLQRTARAADIAGAAARTGYNTSAEQDYRLADLGIGADQAQSGFSSLLQQQELFNPLTGHNEGAIGVDQQLAAAFGQNPAALTAIEKRRQERVAEFGGGGSFAGGSGGISGIGRAT